MLQVKKQAAKVEKNSSKLKKGIESAKKSANAAREKAIIIAAARATMKVKLLNTYSNNTKSNRTLNDKPIRTDEDLKKRWKKSNLFCKYSLIDGLTPSDMLMKGLKQQFPNESVNDLQCMVGAIFNEVVHRASAKVSGKDAHAMRNKVQKFKKTVNCTEYNGDSE